MFKPNLTIHL